VEQWEQCEEREEKRERDHWMIPHVLTIEEDNFLLGEPVEKTIRRARFVAERTLGKPLPPGVVVHHADGILSNDSPGNLVLCEDHAYHMLLHKRARIEARKGNKLAQRCVARGIRIYAEGKERKAKKEEISEDELALITMQYFKIKRLEDILSLPRVS